MPIIRYFIFVGALLLALLFAADRYLPAPVEHGAAADPDRTIIRIASARSLPEKIVFDTLPQTNVPTIAQSDPVVQAPQDQVREAIAAMPAALSREIKKGPPTGISATSRSQQRRSAKPSKSMGERRLAFERHDPFLGGWW